MAAPEFPLVRPELVAQLRRGDAALGAAMRSNARSVRMGAVILDEEEPHDFVYRLESGWTGRTRTLCDGDRQIITVFLPGEIFGVKCMLMERQPDAITALTDVSVTFLDQQSLHELAVSNPDVALRLMFQLGEDERRLHNWTIAKARPSVERVALFLLDLRGRLSLRGLVQGDSFRVPLTQEQIGERTGMSLVHTNRVLKELREQGVASIERGRVHITDLERLRRIAFPLLDVYEREEPAFGAAAH